MEGLSAPGSLKILEIGGNKVGPRVESVLARIAETNPELDVARDIPERNQSDNIVSSASVKEGGKFGKGEVVNMSDVNAAMKAAGWKIG